jgi:hypothetical protein
MSKCTTGTFKKFFDWLKATPTVPEMSNAVQFRLVDSNGRNYDGYLDHGTSKSNNRLLGALETTYLRGIGSNIVGNIDSFTLAFNTVKLTITLEMLITAPARIKLQFKDSNSNETVVLLNDLVCADNRDSLQLKGKGNDGRNYQVGLSSISVPKPTPVR